ncbi:MAG: tyrosine-type recombinase/integrase [Planctomycetota bacterium]
MSPQIDETVNLNTMAMADLLERANADPDLSPTRRRDTVSAINRLVALSGRSVNIEASFPVLRGVLRQIERTATELSPKSLSNMKSLVKSALERYGAVTRAPLKKHLSQDWLTLRGHLPTAAYVRGLSNFMHWCSREGIAPGEVSDAVIADYNEYLTEQTFNRKHRAVYRRVCLLWNRAVEEIPEWPTGRVTMPDFRDRISFPLSDFPASFGADLDAYVRVMAGDDLLAPNTPSKPRSHATLKIHRHRLLALASALVRAGHPIEKITSLAVLVEPGNARRALTFYHGRLGGKTAGLFETASTLVVAAQLYVLLPDAQMKPLRDLLERLKCRQRGMTDKNKKRIRQFHDHRNQARFLGLTAKLLKLADKAANPDKAALIFQTAVLHEIELNAPLRLGNLRRLNLDRHIRFSGNGRRRRVLLSIPATEVKNRQALEFELSLALAELLDVYIARHRPRLVTGPDEGWLFPGVAPGQPKTEMGIREQLCGAVRKHTRIIVNPHIYRHIAAFFYLEAHPEDYETVRRLLGHTSINTTITFYAGFERHSAVRRYNEHLLDRRLELGAE